jgi:hypothetical protein
MIYLKRLWNLIVFFFSVCVFLLITPLSFVIEILIILPILYILKNEIYTEKYDPFSVRVVFWLSSKLTFNTNKK